MPNYRRDLTKGGMYFFTVALQDRNKDYLVRYIDEFRAAYVETQTHFPFETIAICILPKHFHLIMQLPENDDDYLNRLKYLKINFTKRLPRHCFPLQTQSQQKRGEKGIWQRRFWEHLIRDEKDLANHMDYIYYNPVKHKYVQNVKDWKCSSFHRDVKKGIYAEDWGSSAVNEKIIQLYSE